MAAKQGFVNWIETVASGVSNRVLSVTDWIGQQFHVSSQIASRIGFFFVWTLGITFIGVDEYALAILSWFLASLVLFSKAIRWQGLANRPRLSKFVRAFCVIAAIAYIPLSFVWTQAKRGDKPWTSLTLASRSDGGPSKYFPGQPNKNPPPKLMVTTQSRFMFNDSSALGVSGSNCPCTIVSVVATVNNVGYSPQTTVSGWKLGVTLSDGRKELAPAIPLPKDLVFDHYDTDPNQATYMLRSDENLLDRSATPIAIGDHRSGVLFFFVRGLSGEDLARNMVSADIFYQGIDFVSYRGHIDANPNQRPEIYVPGLKSGVEWGDGAFK